MKAGSGGRGEWGVIAVYDTGVDVSGKVAAAAARLRSRGYRRIRVIIYSDRHAAHAVTGIRGFISNNIAISLEVYVKPVPPEPPMDAHAYIAPPSIAGLLRGRLGDETPIYIVEEG